MPAWLRQLLAELFGPRPRRERAAAGPGLLPFYAGRRSGAPHFGSAALAARERDRRLGGGYGPGGVPFKQPPLPPKPLPSPRRGPIGAREVS